MEIKGANDIKLLEQASRYSLDENLKKRLKKLVDKSESTDKVDVALEYSHSVTKSETRGT